MQPEREELEFGEVIERMVALVEQVEQAEPAVRDPMMELLDYVETWHREGITRLAMAIPPDALDAAREDPIVAHLLDTYLGEDDDVEPTAVVEDALEEIRPYVHSHGGEMEFVGVDGGVVTLRLLGSCDGCPSSMVTLTQGVEQILRDRWPGFQRLEVEGDDGPSEPAPKLLQIQSLRG